MAIRLPAREWIPGTGSGDCLVLERFMFLALSLFYKVNEDQGCSALPSHTLVLEGYRNGFVSGIFLNMIQCIPPLLKCFLPPDPGDGIRDP
jgi:hypothetical protein